MTHDTKFNFETQFEINIIPELKGEMIAYSVEIHNHEKDEWERATIKKSTDIGVPSPLINKHIYAITNLYGKEQALSLAWWTKAKLQQHPLTFEKKVRIVPHDIKFDITIKPSKEKSEILI